MLVEMKFGAPPEVMQRCQMKENTTGEFCTETAIRSFKVLAETAVGEPEFPIIVWLCQKHGDLVRDRCGV